MATTLLVSRDGNSLNLKINGTESKKSNVSVNPGDTVVWRLDPASGLGKLVAVATVTPDDHGCYIPDKDLATLITSFTPQPDGSISGTVVSTSPGKGKFQNYKICFTLPDGSEHWDDPKLQMNA